MIGRFRIQILVFIASSIVRKTTEIAIYFIHITKRPLRCHRNLFPLTRRLHVRNENADIINYFHRCGGCIYETTTRIDITIYFYRCGGCMYETTMLIVITIYFRWRGAACTKWKCWQTSRSISACFEHGAALKSLLRF